MKDFVEKAKEIIRDNRYMTIATASRAGEPWISPVFFAYDADYNLYWVSNKDSQHSILIRVNPHVAIAIFDSSVTEGDGDCVYIEALASELENIDELRIGIGILGKRVTKDRLRVKSVEEVTGSAAWRMYKAVPKTVSKLTDGQYIHGQYVDQRMEIQLK
jgi:nitroimidazol reductase NimA-like FMN-containing flavoprotein (pyridoxamine 5'-phosphate oxidase superfamily)